MPKGTLPAQLTPLIGRRRELAAVLGLVAGPDVRLVTITGPGGVGKTRLGLLVAEELAGEFGDGVWFIPLASIGDPGLVVSAVAQALGLREAGERPLLLNLKGYLQDKHALLLLDNFEHVISAAPVVVELLAASRSLKVLVTSRAALHLSGEHEFQVPPLELPDLKQLPDIDALLQCESVALFSHRVSAVKSDFHLTSTNAPAVAELCVRLDGLPLAIELAAARAKLVPPQTMLDRMVGAGHLSPLQLLTGGARDLPARQRTLRNTIEWSYGLLAPEERRLLWRLAVFAGGCTLEAAETVCNSALDSPATIFDGLASLVNNSLLRQVEGTDNEPRLAMLETIREYALARLAEGGEEDSVRRLHASNYLALADAAAAGLKGADQERWLNRLEIEHDNLRAALAWALDRGEAVTALRLGAALWWFWFVRGHFSEGRRWLERALANSAAVGAVGELPPLRAKVLNGAGVLAFYQGDIGQAGQLCGESLALSRQLDDNSSVASALNGLALVARSGGNLSAARAMYEESLALLRHTGDRWGVAYTLAYLGVVAQFQGDFALARSLAEHSLTRFRELGDKQGSAAPLTILGQANIKLGDYKAARLALEECLGITRALRDQRSTARALHNLGGVAFAEGDYTTSRSLRQEALSILCELGDRLLIAQFMVELAEVVAAQGECQLAAKVLGAAEALRDSMGATLLPAYVNPHERAVATASARLSDVALAAAWVEGRSMLPGQVLAALKQAIPPETLVRPELVASSVPAPAATGETDIDSAVVTPAGQSYTSHLTVREVEVLRLVATGLTDSQIAEKLVLSPRTVNSHLRSIYSKLDVSSRTAATRLAIDYHLI